MWSACFFSKASTQTPQAPSRLIAVPNVPFELPVDLIEPHGPHASSKLQIFLPDHSQLTTARISLGELLFVDTRLSGNQSMACITCHRPETSFTSSIVTDANRNPPVIFNRLFSERQFWNARAATLEDQIRHTMSAASEMNSNGAKAAARLQKDPKMVGYFRDAFGTKRIEEKDVYRALASFVRSIVSYDSKFDRANRGGEPSVSLSEIEIQGQHLFFEKYKCSVCHSGPNFTNEMMSPPCYPQFGQKPAVASGPKRRFTQEFKTPSLRGLAKSSPYFHNGSLETIDQTIEFYDRSGPPPMDFVNADLFQVPINEISKSEVDQLRAFLNTLNGRIEYGFPRKTVEN